MLALTTDGEAGGGNSGGSTASRVSAYLPGICDDHRQRHGSSPLLPSMYAAA